jgi:murein DD-endopeptidase MepM/ murein hydrolase activator NlpD
VVWEGYDLFLEESLVDPQQIIRMITSTRNGQPYLPVMVTRVEEYDVEVPFDSIELPDDNMYVNSTNTVQRGANGTNRVRARVSYVNGEEIRRNVMQTTVVFEPVTQRTLRGTRQPVNRGNFPTHREYGKFVWPVVNTAGQPTGNVSRGIGGGHSGLDIAAPMGTPIIAGADGVVVLSKYNHFSYGHTIIIRHEDGMETLYAHASVLIAREGEQVKQGDHIANVGSTGRSTGPHLHFEVIEAGGNRRLNPQHFLPSRD